MASAYDATVLAISLPAMTRANPALLSSGTYYVQELAGRIVACGGWTFEEPGSAKIAAGVGHIRHFATVTDAARKGLGRGIVERCKQDARAATLHTLMAYASLNAEPFYASLGFVTIRRTALKIGDGLNFPTVVMAWTAS